MADKLSGVLIVNPFIDGTKWTDIYSLLCEAARQHSVVLKLQKTFEAVNEVGLVAEPKPDFALFWDKDICAARQLEAAGIRLFNSASAIEICDNKALTALCLSKHNIAAPRSVIGSKTFEGIGYNDFAFLEKAAKTLGFPMVIKEVYGSFGKQVFSAEDLCTAKEIVSRISPREFIMQELVETSFGRDVRINVVGGRAVASMLRRGKAGEFRSNISNGGSAESYEPSESQVALAVAAAKAAGLDFAGVDVLFGKDGEPLICEINSNPHFVSTLECTGFNMAEAIIEHICKEMRA